MTAMCFAHCCGAVWGFREMRVDLCGNLHYSFVCNRISVVIYLWSSVSCRDVAEAVVSDALAKCLLAYTAQEGATDEMYAARHEAVHRNLKREAYGRRLDERRSPVSQRHEQQPGCDVIVSSFLERTR